MYAATLLALAIAAIVAILALKFVFIYIKHLKAHQFFERNAPHLPVLPPSSTFMGSITALGFHKKNWRKTSELHDKLGPSFGFYFGPQPWIATKDLDLIKLIELDDAHKHINRHKFRLPFYEFDHSIFQADGDNWRRIRRTVATALTNHKVRGPEISDDIQSVVDQLADGLEFQMTRKAGPKVEGSQRAVELNAEDAFQRYAMAIVFLITYKRNNVIDFRADHDSWVDSIGASSRRFVNPITIYSMVFPFLRPLCHCLILLHPSGRMYKRIIGYIEEATNINRIGREQHERAQRRMGNSSAKEAFSSLASCGTFKRRLVDSFIDAFLEKKITYQDFMGTALFVFLAGFETTSDTITYFVWQLAQRPDVQEKVRHALIEKGADADYFQWCIMETIRMHPAVPLGTGRILGEDVEVNGVLYPKGAYVQPSTYSIHHDANIWPDPEEFKPERWADTSKNHPAAFMGFGLGVRNCVGGKLAIHEVKLVVRMLLSKYRIEKCKDTVDTYEFSSPATLYTIPDKDIIVRLVELERPLVIGTVA